MQALVRLLSPHRSGSGWQPGQQTVEHVLRLGGFAAPRLEFHVDGAVAAGSHVIRGRPGPVIVHADGHQVRDDALYSTVRLTRRGWAALVVTVDGDLQPDVEVLVPQLESHDAAQRDRLAACWLPRLHPSGPWMHWRCCGRARIDRVVR